MTAVYESFAHASGILGADITVTKPTGTVDGNLLIACVNSSAAVTPPAGWTEHAASIDANQKLYWKVASSEGASWTWVIAGTGNTVVTVARLSGADQTTPIDVGSGVNGTGGTIVIPSVTPTKTVLLFQIVSKQANATFTEPGTATERFDATTGGTVYSSAGGDEVVSAGATGTRTWTPSGATGPRVLGFMVGINPSDLSGGATAQVETATLSATGSLGVSKDASPLAETVGLSAAGGGAYGGSLVETVDLSATGQTNVYGDAEQVVTATRIPTESTINEATGTEVVTLESGAAAGAISGASQTVTTGLTAAVAYGTTGDLALAAVTTLAATGQLDTYQGAELVVTAGREAAGSANYSGAAALVATVARASTGLAVRRFLGPTQEQAMADWFWGHFSVPVGITLMKRDGHYVRVPVPTADELDAGGVEGTDWFRGGYEYVVSEEVWDALVADGFAQA